MRRKERLDLNETNGDEFRSRTTIVKMGFWYSASCALEQPSSRDMNHYLTDTYEAMLSQKTIRSLFDNFRFNLSLEEIILNTRRLANFILGRSHNLEFTLEPIVVKEIFETQTVKN